MDRSIETIVVLLGILKAGGAYVPLDLAAPPQRLAFMLLDTRSPSPHPDGDAEPARAFTGATICLDADLGILSRQTGHKAHDQANAADLATS